METQHPPLDQFLDTLDTLSSEELEQVEKRLASVRGKKNGTPRIPAPSPAPVARDLFAISFSEYLAMSRADRDALQISAYENYPKWIEQELARHDARWILVCGGKVVESGPTLQSYPRSPKVRSVGEQFGLAPFVFVRGPMIEESIWSILPYDDCYPTLSIFIAAEDSPPLKLQTNGLALIADLDTGSTDVLLDYEQLVSNGIIENSDALLHMHHHLNRSFRYYSLPVLIGALSESGEMVSGIIEAMCVLNWAQSPLRLSNPFRQVLAGRNLLMKLPLRIQLDGRKRTTQILGR